VLDPETDVSVSPEGLPLELKEIFKQTGYWDLVSQLREIRFFGKDIADYNYRNLNDNSLAGRASSYLGYVEIEWQGKSSWEIAQLLVHEAAHVAWRSEAQNRYELESLPNERHSCLHEADFLEQYLNICNPAGSEKIDIEMEFYYHRACGMAASLAMGIPLENFNPNSNILPAADYLSSLGLNDLSQFDLDIAAYHQVNIFAENEAALHRFIWNRIIPTTEEENHLVENAEKILNEVMGGEAYLSANYNLDQSQEQNLELGLFRTDGSYVSLSENEVKALLELFTSAASIYEIAGRQGSNGNGNYSCLLSAYDLLPVIFDNIDFWNISSLTNQP
jgi:hypothetical protein